MGNPVSNDLSDDRNDKYSVGAARHRMIYDSHWYRYLEISDPVTGLSCWLTDSCTEQAVSGYCESPEKASRIGL